MIGWSCEYLFVSLLLSNFWDIVYELHCSLFLILVNIAWDVHISMYELSAWCLPDFCVPDEDYHLSLLCLLLLYLIYVVRCHMIIISLSYFLFLLCWFSLILVLFRHSSKVGLVRWPRLEWENIGVMHGLCLVTALRSRCLMWLNNLYHLIL